ncbi:hypothetical protein K438DRAFT_1974502 [Mycena galopus ATCC 62051]|nr:hypothetical protein K438DRAFT_1974502 [Mycena galopus ATCC 62051]
MSTSNTTSPLPKPSATTSNGLRTKFSGTSNAPRMLTPNLKRFCQLLTARVATHLPWTLNTSNDTLRDMVWRPPCPPSYLTCPFSTSNAAPARLQMCPAHIPELPKVHLRCASLVHPIPCHPVPTPHLTSNASKRHPQSTCPPTLNPITLHAPTSRPCPPTSNARPPTSNTPRPLITPPSHFERPRPLITTRPPPTSNAHAALRIPAHFEHMPVRLECPPDPHFECPRVLEHAPLRMLPTCPLHTPASHARLLQMPAPHSERAHFECTPPTFNTHRPALRACTLRTPLHFKRPHARPCSECHFESAPAHSE